MRHPYIAASFLAVSLACTCARAGYPDRPIKLIAGTAPGGTVDRLARAIAKHLQDRLGQAVIVDNRAGAGGTLAAEAVAAAPPDGYTLTITSAPTAVVTPLLE
jgi:tripartite-type tricarboxylate transporter receptor subunit TctC